MKIEVLFPEFCNLFGDAYNMVYLEKTLPETVLPSTSPANAAWSLERLTEVWKIIRSI